MKYITLIIVSILFISCDGIGRKSNQTSLPEINNGVIDLTLYDFKKSGTVKLDGYWEFYWLRLYNSEDFKSINKPQQLRFFEMPGAWNNKNKISDISELGSFGFATFRLLVKVKNKSEKFGLNIKEMNCSYNLFINGNLVSNNGKVSGNSKEMKPEFLPGIVFFTTDSDVIEIILQISNYVDNKGGSLHSIIIGLDNQIIYEKEKALISELFLFGILLIMGIYHFLIYFIRKRDNSLLYFGCICIFIAVRIALTGERFFYVLIHDLNWDLFVKIEHLTNYILISALMLFILNLFRKDVNIRIVSFFLLITASYIIIILPSSAIIYSSLLTSYIIILIVEILFFLYILIRVTIKKRDLALLMFSGYIFMFITAIHDILYFFGIINTGNLLAAGMVVFILSQSVVLSMKFNNTMNKIKVLSRKLVKDQKILEEINLALDQKVLERTRIINNQKEEIENQIVMSESIQRSILPKPAPDLNGVKIAFLYKPMMQIGGDFVDYIIKNENEIGFFICDVSGHGVPGAFLSSMVKMELLNNWHKNVSSPGKVLNSIYNSISKNLGGNFITAAAAYLNLDSGEFIMANAGHPATFCLCGDQILNSYKPHGKALFEYFKPDYEEIKINLKTGFKIFMYTDGLIETFNAGSKMYGESRLVDFLKKNSNLQVQKLCDAVLSEVIEYTGGAQYFNDDVTMLAFEYTGR